jgi:anti-anti-sigma regulatory factor
MNGKFMTNGELAMPIAINKVQDYLVVSVQGIVDDSILLKHQETILKQCQFRKVKGIILDFNAVCALDRFAFKIFSDLTKTVFLLGIPTIWVSLNPGVVSSLIDLEIDSNEISTAGTLEEGLQILGYLARPTKI